MRRVLLLATGVFFALSNCKANVVYTLVEETVGPYTVTGTITTNGAVGTLSTSQIVAFNLMATDGGSFPPITLNSASGATADIGGSSLNATSTELIFNFSVSGVNAFGLFATNGSDWALETDFAGATYWGENVVCGPCNSNNEEFFQNNSVNTETAFVAAQSASVPEPGSLLPLGMVLYGLRIATRRHSNSVPTFRN